MTKATPTARAIAWVFSVLALAAIASGQAAGQAAPAPWADAEYYIHERMKVKDDKLDWFVAYYRDEVLPILALTDGYLGTVFSTTLPKADEDFGPVLPLGPPEETFLPHYGIKLEGTVTNTQIHFDALLRGTFNFQVYHYFRDAEALNRLLPEFEPNWEKVHGAGPGAWKTLEDAYFTHLENHWDTVYRIVR